MDVLSSCLEEDTDDETDMANETGDVCSECVTLAATDAAEASLSSLLPLVVPLPAATSVLTTDTDGADEESPMTMSLVLLLLLLLLLTVVSSRGLGALFGDVMLAFLVDFIRLSKLI